MAVSPACHDVAQRRCRSACEMGAGPLLRCSTSPPGLASLGGSWWVYSVVGKVLGRSHGAPPARDLAVFLEGWRCRSSGTTTRRVWVCGCGHVIRPLRPPFFRVPRHARQWAFASLLLRTVRCSWTSKQSSPAGVSNWGRVVHRQHTAGLDWLIYVQFTRRSDAQSSYSKSLRKKADRLVSA